MIVLAYLGSQCQKFHTAGYTSPFFTSFYLETCIWPDAVSWWNRQRNSECASNFVQISDLSVQGYHWWWELYLRLWPWDKVAILPMEKFKLTETRKGETGEEQSQEHAHHCLWHQWDCSQRIHPSRPVSQFCILLWRFTVTAWECGKTFPWTLTTKELAVAPWQCTNSHFIFTREFFHQKQHDCLPGPPPHPPQDGPPQIFFFERCF
jgi:hypothetical protein